MTLEAIERLNAFLDTFPKELNYFTAVNGRAVRVADLRSLLSSYEAQAERLRVVEEALDPERLEGLVHLLADAGWTNVADGVRRWASEQRATLSAAEENGK